MSHPKTVKLFKPWAAAMVEGATVDKPDYGKKMKAGKSSRMTSRRRKKRKKRKKRMSKHG